MQLVAYGAQDVYLTGSPQITFFKTIYRRHTNFAIESIEQTFNGQANFGNRVTCTVSRNGDLIWKTYLIANVSFVSTTSGSDIHPVDHFGHFMVSSVELQIGGQQIDKHYGDWLDIWNELTQAEEKWHGYEKMVGEASNGTVVAAAGSSRIYYVPFIFWFNRNAGLALPLIALQYHEVKFIVEFRPASDLTLNAQQEPGDVAVLNMQDCSIWIDYIYLDTDERRRFAQTSHEYLIDQLQFTGAQTISTTSGSNSSFRARMDFNHPCKFLAWNVRCFEGENQWNNYTGFDTVETVGQDLYAEGVNSTLYYGNWFGKSLAVQDAGVPAPNPFVAALVQLNGHDRFDIREGNYFSLVQPYQHFPRVPVTGVNVYSFALNPVEHQPSGTCNMSRIDNATLQITVNVDSTEANLYIWAVNYNVLRITSGMGGIAYSN